MLDNDLEMGSVLESSINLSLPNSSRYQNPEDNPFNNWLNNNFGSNAPSKYDLKGGVIIKQPAITVENFMKYLYESAKFVSEISGPISNIILKTYQKQTKVFQAPIAKKETTSFKIKPGSAYKIRCCE